MPCIHIIEGPVGAGKTTFANLLGEKYKTRPLVLDDWMVCLFSPDRPADEVWAWYAARKKRCIDQIWKVACGLLDYENNAIVELGLLQRESRLDFYHRVENAGFDFRVHVLDASREERWQRVQTRNVEKGKTFAMSVTEEVFTLASEIWEEPTSEECKKHDIRFVKNSGEIEFP